MSGASTTTADFLPDLATEHLTEMQLGLVLAIRALAAGTGDDLLDGEELRLVVADLYPPGVILSPEMLRVPLLHQGLLNFLRDRAVTLGGDSGMRSVKRLAATLYPAGPDKNFAVSVLNNLEERQAQLCRYGDAPAMPGLSSRLDRPSATAGPSRATSHALHGGGSPGLDHAAQQLGLPQDVRYSGGAPTAGREPSSSLPPLASFGGQATYLREPLARADAPTTMNEVADSNLAHRVSLRMKDNHAKFSGDAQECLDDYVAEYDLVGRDFGLSREQKLRYSHNLLRGDAKRYYLSELEPSAASYADAVRSIRSEYHSAIHQSQAQNTLSSLRKSNFVAEGMTEEKALMETYKTVAKVSKLLPISHKGEAHRINYLRGAVVGYSWATEPLSRIPTAQLGFQQLYGELQSALFLSTEAKRALVQDGAVTAKPVATSSGTLDVLYEGQRWYANNPKGKMDRAAGKTASRFNPLSFMGCFNCDKPDHAAKDCPAPHNGAK